MAATTAALAWQVREHQVLQSTRPSAAVHHANVNALREKIAVQAKRAAAADADAVLLQQALDAAAAAPVKRPLSDAQTEADAAMARARELQRAGKNEEALAAYVQVYRSVAGRRGMMHQQIALGALASLGRTYPPARDAVRMLRDEALKKWEAAPGSAEARELIAEIGNLNERLGEGRASLALYDRLPVGDPGRQALGIIAHSSFIAARRYADALVGKTFGAMLNEFSMGVRSAERLSGLSQASHREFVVKSTLSNIEALTGAGKTDEAKSLTEKLLAFDGSESTHAALQQHVQRATSP